MVDKGFLKEHSSLFMALQHVADWLVISVTGCVAHRLYLGSWVLPGHYVGAIGIALLLAAWLFPKFDLYLPWRGASLLEEGRRISIGWAAVLFFMFAFAFSTKSGSDFSRGWIAFWSTTAWLGLLLERIALRISLRGLRRAGFNVRRIVIVGEAALGREVAERISAAPWAGLEVLGFFSDAYGSADCATLHALGRLSDLSDYVQQHEVDQVWITMALRDEDKVRKVLHDLRHSTVDIRFVPDIFGFRLLNHSVMEVAGLPILSLSTTPMVGLNLLVKMLEDKVLSIIILAMISPLMLLIALAVKLSSPGPVFYRQERVGWNGRTFTMFKFRTMPVDAESKTGPVWAKAGERRATPFGAFLRRTSMDELPQFINVVRGEMSIVGPRPERPAFVDKFKDEIPDYMKKHLVKAGITGWAQVNGWRGDTNLEKRIEYDLYYIEHWSLWLDMKIILLTLFKGFIHKNAY